MPFTFKLSKRLALMKASLVPAAAAALAAWRPQERPGLTGPTLPSRLSGAGRHISRHHHARALADSAVRRFCPDERCHRSRLERHERRQFLGQPAYRSHLPRRGAAQAGRSVVHSRSNPLITPCLGDGSPGDQYMCVDGLTVATSKP